MPRPKVSWVVLGKSDRTKMSGLCKRCGKTSVLPMEYPMSIPQFTKKCHELMKLHENCPPNEEKETKQS
jgi:hypothetical protein